MKCNFQWLGVEDGERKWRLDCYHDSEADAMTCKVNWRRFLTRQNVLKRKLASDCGCDRCKEILRHMARKLNG